MAVDRFALPDRSNLETGEVPRRSIWERMNDLADPTSMLFEVEVVPHVETSLTSTTFRVDTSGELVEDSAAALAASFDPNEPLGELDLQGAEIYHLLALPTDALGAEVEALAISLWGDAGWSHPGSLHLTRGATLEGPWTLSNATRDALGLSPSAVTVWRLRCPAIRGAKPTPEMQRIDEWAQAFPEGMPVGVEYTVLLALRRMARRLGGELRLAGSGKVMAPDPESAVNLQIYTNQYIPPNKLQGALCRHFKDVALMVVGGSDAEPGGPYALSLPRGSRSRVIVGVRAVDHVPRVLRWEPWAQGLVYLIEIQWANATQMQFINGQLTRSGRLERTQVLTTIGMIGTLVAEMVEEGSIIDEDDFVLGFDELPPTEEAPRL